MLRVATFVCGLALVAVISGTRLPAAEDARIIANGDALCVTIGSLQAEAEELRFDARRAGPRLLTLNGNARIRSGDFQANGKTMEISFSSDGKMVVQITGDVRISNAKTRAVANSAQIDFASSNWALTGDADQAAKLICKTGKSVSQIEADSIRVNVETNAISVASAGKIE